MSSSTLLHKNRSSDETGRISLPDTQSERDSRGIVIQRVGIKGLRLPVFVPGEEGSLSESIGQFDLGVELDAGRRGTHMSRFVEMVQEWSRIVTPAEFDGLLKRIPEKMECERAFVELECSKFVKKRTPASNRDTISEYVVGFHGRVSGAERQVETIARVVVTTLCPCSKAISAGGAHNQRGIVRIKALSETPISIDRLIRIAEASGSSSLFPLLKREDEKAVTETAYENPVFVEDLVRNIAVKLKREPGIRGYEVEAENEESIHAHNAHAFVTESF